MRLRVSPGGVAIGAAACAFLLALAAWLRPERPVEAGLQGWPPAAEMDTLRPFLRPGPEVAATDEYEVFLPAASAEPGGADRGAPAPPPQRTEWRLSAVLTVGGQRVAILNDQPVRQGARVQDGAEVVEIRSDAVVIREPDGSRRTIRLSPEEIQ